MSIRATNLVGALLSVSACAATTASDLPVPEILRMLSQHSGEQVTYLIEARSEEDESGTWYVEADSAAEPSSIDGLCERTRAFALIKRADLVPRNWQILEIQKATAVAVKRADRRSCENLPYNAFFAVSDAVRLVDVVTLVDAIDSVQACARQQPGCDLKLTATPWRILDAVAEATMPPIILSMTLDENLSSAETSCYDARLSINESERVYMAYVCVASGHVQGVSIVQIVP